MKRILALALAFVLVLGYIPVGVSAADGDYTVAGTFNGWSTTATPMTDNRNGTHTVTLPLAAGYYEFKVTDGTWNNNWGGTGPDGNYPLTVVRDCDVTFKFLLSGEKASVLVDDKVTVYFVNSENWTNVYAYTWSDSQLHMGAWGGTRMTNVADNIWSVKIPAADASNIIFHNGSGTQTGNLSVPYDGRLVYTYNSGWTTCASSHLMSNGTCQICGASCSHSSHGTDGNCSSCGLNVGHSYPSTGLCACGLQAEALVDDIHFASFDSAINVVSPGGTIKLLTDVTAGTVNGNNGHNLDLNGKTLTVSELWAPSTSFLRIQDNTTAQEGKIVGDVYTSQYLYLEGGTIEGTVWLTSYSQLKGSFTMTGGAIKADTDLYINTDGAAVKLQGGEFIDGLKIVNNASVTTPMPLADTISSGYRFYQNGSVVDMTGVTDTISGSTVKVQSHTHAYSSTTGFCPCGDECAHSSKTNGVCDTCGMADAHTHAYVNGACSCGRTAEVAVIYVDDSIRYFDTLQVALDTFSKNNSFAYVKLLTHIAVGDNISADIYTHYTLDLNGYSLTAERLIVPASGGMEIMDSSVGQTGQVNAIVHAHGPLTIWSGTFNDTVLVTTMSNVKGSVTVRDGKFTAATDFQIADDGCSLSLWSGTFPGGIKVEAISGATKDELADFLYNNNSYFQDCEKVTLTAGQSEISGGHVVVAYDAKHQFGSNTKCSYCGLDAIVSMSLDGVTTYYGTVYDLRQDLVQENAGCTIQLLTDITTTYFADKDGRCGFYLDLNGHTLTASDGVSLPSSSGATIMDTSAEKNGKIVGTVYAAYSTALTGGTIEGTVSFPKKASATGYTFQMEGGAIDADMDFGISDNNTTIVLTGGTFPGGISIACGDYVTTPMTLADCISGSYKYMQNGKVVTLTDGQTEITGDVKVLSHASHSFDDSGYCAGCGAQAIASVTRDGTTTYYVTEYYLEHDLHAGMSDCTVQLLQDFTCETFDIACGCILDLNGHTLTATQDVLIALGEESIIMDTSAEKDGKIVGRVLAGTTTTLTSGTIEGSVAFAATTGSYTFYMQGGIIDAATDFAVYNESVTIELTGGTFPGGIKVDGYHEPMLLEDCIPTGYAYFKDSNVVTLTEGQTEITGGDVTVAAYTAHTHTYGAEGFCEGFLPGTYAVCGAYEMPEGAGTDASPYLIDNAGKLFWFASVVNGGYEDTNGNSAACAKVTEDITIPEGMAWTPISGYRGTFDGGSKTISGMHVSSDAYYVGMFSKTGTCTIKDLSITDSSFETTNSWGYVGAIAGYCGDGTSEKATITGCYVGDVTVTGWTAGGITGCLHNYSEVKNCSTSDSLVVNAEQEGGIVAGRCQSGSYIEWVSAQGTVTGYYAGGIVGYVVNDAGPYVNRSNEVVMSTYVGNVGNESTLYAGGIIGYVSSGSKAAINNCSVKCNVTAEYSLNSRACGLLGHSNNGSNSMVSVSNSFTIDTTLNPANINKASLASGGATVTNCYSDDQETILTLPSVIEVNCAKKTDEQFRSGEVAYLLDAPQSVHVWGQNIDNGNMNYGFPVRGQYKVYQVIVDCEGTIGYSNTDEDKTAHDPVHVPEASATCQAAGTIEHWVCDACSKLFAEESCTTEVEEEDLLKPQLAHSYTNGFCANVVDGAACDAYEPAVLVTAENREELGLAESDIGYYAITNAGQLYWFADKVDNDNANFGAANVVLTDNITVNTGTITADSTGVRVWNPIGDGSNIFNGTFDGNGQTVSGIYYSNSETNYIALIGRTGTNALVKNVTVTNSYFCGYYHVAGIVGRNEGTVTGCVNEATMDCDGYSAGIVGTNYGKISNCFNYGTIYGYANQGGIVGNNRGTVELCGNEGSISTDWMHAGGIVGDNNGTIRNCWNTGDVYAERNCVGGIAGSNIKYSGNTVPVVENCWSTGSVTPTTNSAVGGIVGRSKDSSQNNCYSVMKPVGEIQDSSAQSVVENMEIKTPEQFASGEVAYLLGGVWGQDLDNGKTVQTVPTFDGADVYYGYLNCASTEAVYTNTAASSTPVEHDYENGFCELVAGETHYEPAVPVTAENREELGLAESYIGYYAITNAGQLYWFADKVDNENATYGSVNVVLTKDITVNEGTVTAFSTGMRDWNPIGWFTNTSDNQAAFSGTFDGNGKTVSGLYFNNNSTSCVGLVSYLAAEGTVKNVTVTNSYIMAYQYAGAIAGRNAGLITGCINHASINTDGNYAAGIAGWSEGTVELCGNTGAIYADATAAGGIVGKVQGTTNSGARIRNCWNTGSISVSGDNAGGIVGFIAAFTRKSPYCYVSNCWSTGSVTAGDTESVAGVVGYADCTTVSNCYSTVSPVGEQDLYVTVSKTEQKTLDQFASGEVAYLLGGVWGQDLDNGKTPQTVPTFDGADVYYGYDSCAATAAKYTNDSTVSATTISHDWAYTANGAEITAECLNGCGTDGGKVTLTAPANTTYAGVEKSVTVEGSLTGITSLPEVAYEGSRVNVGTFIAKLTVGDATAQLPVQILPYELQIQTFVPEAKVYDGTTTCGIKSLSFVSTANGEELVLGTDFTAQLTFPSADAGEYTDVVMTVTLMDTALAGNYKLKTDTVTAITHTITPATITVANVQVENKIYDATTDAAVASVTASGIVTGDDVKVEARAAFADKNAGESKTANLTYTLTGADAGNYVLAETTGTTTATITPATITVTDVQAEDKVYDGTADAAVSAMTVSGIVTGDDVKVETVGAFAD